MNDNKLTQEQCV